MKKIGGTSNSDIREILEILLSDSEIKINFKASYTDYFYQLKQDQPHKVKGPFYINSEGFLCCGEGHRELNQATDEQREAIQVCDSHPDGYPSENETDLFDPSKPVYWGHCYVWCAGYFSSEGFIQLIRDFLDEYDYLEDDEMAQEGFGLFENEFLEIKYPEHLKEIMEDHGIVVSDYEFGAGTKIGLGDVSWCTNGESVHSVVEWYLS